MPLILKTTPAFDNGVARGCPQGAHLLWSKMPKVSHTPHYQKDISFSELLHLSAPLGTLWKLLRKLKCHQMPHISALKLKCCMGACVHLIHGCMRASYTHTFLRASKKVFKVFLHLASKEGLT